MILKGQNLRIYTVEGGDATVAYKAAVKSVDRAVASGIMHKNTAARKKSQLTLKLNNAK